MITTLLTPYLIKGSDRFVLLFDRLAPQPFVSALGIYTRWVGQFGTQNHPSLAKKLVRKWGLQMLLNVILVAGVFIAAAFAAQHRKRWLSSEKLDDATLSTLIWVGAVIISMPMLIATSRKFQALGLLLAETRVSASAAGTRTEAIRAIVSQAVPIAGTVTLGGYVLILSSSLLPTFRLLIALTIALGLVAWLLRRAFIRVYSKAQIALQETFQAHPVEVDPHAPARLPSILRDAAIEHISVTAESPAAGKLIRELGIRAAFGASIVAIERKSGNIINPGPDEEIKAGDGIVLLGTKEQLALATTAIGGIHSPAVQ